MLYPIFDLNNWFIGGPYNQRVGAYVQAQHSSRLTAMRYYKINKNPSDAVGRPTQGGYAGGNGGRFRYEVAEDDKANPGSPGTVIARGYETDDPEYPMYMNNGGFPLVVYPGMPLLKKGSLYHFVFTNEDASPTLNYASVDWAYSKETTPGSGVFTKNPDPTMRAWYWPAGNAAPTYDDTMIVTPFGIYFVDAMQGNGGYEVTTRNSVPLCWKGSYANGPC